MGCAQQTYDIIKSEEKFLFFFLQYERRKDYENLCIRMKYVTGLAVETSP